MKILILILFLFSLNVFAKVEIKQSHGVQVSCIGYEQCLINCDYQVCEFKVIKTEIRSCSFTISPGRSNSTTSSVDCSIFDEVRLRQ